jgi:acetyltransferase
VAEYPGQLARTHRLFDGRTVTIRPIRPDDFARERRFLEELSGESRYLRFQKWVSAPNEKLAHFLTDIDYEQHMAFVCAAVAGDTEEVVGEARYVVNPDHTSCEFGVMISDGWHNTGIAGLLMEEIIGTARSRGLKSIEGQVLARNTTMLRFARGLGFKVEAVPGDPTIRRVVKKL